MNNNVIKFIDPRRAHEDIREQACVWLARLDKGATPEDLAQLAEWMEEDPLNCGMLMNMAAMWDQTAILSELSEMFPLEEKTLSLQARRRYGMSAAVGALAALVLVAGILLSLRWIDEWDPTYGVDEVYQTAIGERRMLNLPDGSVVTLNTNTRAKFEFDRNYRTVILEHGEGFFTVAKDAKRPFRVYAGATMVEAVGTAFTVHHTEGKQLEVLVTEGKVNFLELSTQEDAAEPATADGRVMFEHDAVFDSIIPLIAGEHLTITPEAQQMEREQLQPDEVDVKLAWRLGMLVFQGDSLETVLQEVSRYTTVKLEAEEAIRDIRIDGLFKAGDIDALLVAMEKNFNLQSERIGVDQIIFTARTVEE